MKRIVSKIFWPTVEVVIVGFFIALAMPKKDNRELVFNVENNASTKMIDPSSAFFISNELTDNNEVKEEIENKEEEPKEIPIIESPKIEEKKETKVVVEEKKEEPVPEIKPAEPVAPTYNVLERKENLRITGYGYDCNGCTSGKTKTGYNIAENIYYDDPEFGQVRIVAADKSIPFYSIVRLSNLVGMDPIIAIVLDHGGTIGFENKFAFDIVFENEKIANETIDPSVQNKVVYELLRRGDYAN